MSTRRQHIRNTRAYLEASFTPLVAEYAFDTTLNAIRAGDGATLGGILQKRWGYDYPLSPAQITANQNDFNPADLKIAETLFLNSDDGRTVTGLSGGSFGRRVTLINRGGFDITLASASASSLAANRFLFEADVVMRPYSAIELQYSVTDSRWMRTAGGLKFATIPQEVLFAGVISPAQIIANQNDYTPAGIATAETLRLSTDASRNITGLVDPRAGSVKTIINVGTNPIVLKNADAGSTAANRFDFSGDVTLAGKQAALLRYDGTDSRWKLIGATAGAAVAAGAVTAQTLAGSAMGMSMINGTLVASVAGGALTVAIKTLAGVDPSAADPVAVIFRSATAANGGYTVVTLTAATSFVVSAGSSLGVPGNNLAFRIWLVAINDLGTFRLGVINCVSGTNIYALQGWGINAACSVEGGAGAADAAQSMYFGAFSGTPAPYVVLGYMTWESGLAAAGTWSAGPDRIQLFGQGGALPGSSVARARLATGALATGSTSIPMDDTVPQNTEGDQFMSLAFTPSSAANIGRVSSQAIMATTGVLIMAMALFRDSAANAVIASQQTSPAASAPFTLRLDTDLIFNSIAATTFKIRIGAQNPTTNTFNGATGARQFGGSENSYILVEEIMA